MNDDGPGIATIASVGLTGIVISILIAMGFNVQDKRNGVDYAVRNMLEGEYYIVAHYFAGRLEGDGVRHLHVDYNRWPDSGYPVTIDQDGTINFWNDVSEKSYNVGGANSDIIGIAFNVDVEEPATRAALDSFEAVVRILDEETPIKIAGTSCHKDYALPTRATLCPGEIIYKQLILEGMLTHRRNERGDIVPL